MKRILFYLLVPVVVACHTSGTPESTVPSADPIPVESTDTTLTFRIKGENQTFRIKKENLRRMPAFQAFLDRWPEIPAVYKDTVSVDLTGDGINEQIVSRITCNNTDCMIYSHILKDGKIVFYDTLRPNDPLLFMDWSEDSIYFKLKPYTIFYDALLKKDMVHEPENGKISEDLIEFYTSPMYESFATVNHDTVKVRMLVDSVKRELRQYKGKYVSTLAHWSGSLLFWNRFYNRFEELYTP